MRCVQFGLCVRAQFCFVCVVLFCVCVCVCVQSRFECIFLVRVYLCIRFVLFCVYVSVCNLFGVCACSFVLHAVFFFVRVYLFCVARSAGRLTNLHAHTNQNCIHTKEYICAKNTHVYNKN